MPNYVHIYRCRCANWTDNQIKVFTNSMAEPLGRIQHFQLREGVGLNDTCQNYLTRIRVVQYDGAIPESAPIKPKAAKRVTTGAQTAGVILGPQLLDHVFKGELNGLVATGYHSKQDTNFKVALPYPIAHVAHRLAAFQVVISRPDKYGVYYVGYKLSFIHQGQPTTTAWKISTMFPDRLSQAAIVHAIKSRLRESPR